MKKIHLLFSVLIPVIFTFSSCQKNNPGPADTGFLYGAYVVNEGNYNSNNGSISYIDLDSSYIVNNIFSALNGRNPGDVVQSFTIVGDKGLIVVNHSAKVEVVDIKTFLSIGTITGCSYPRYALGLTDNKAYLTNGAFQGQVYILDLSGMAITDSIQVGNGPETMVCIGNYVYVANSGGWIQDSTVSVIDINTDKVMKTITTGDNPVDMSIDANGNIWVLCKGKVVYDQNWNIVSETDSKLVLISGSSQEVEKSFTIGQTGDNFNPFRLAVGEQGNVIYYVEHDGVYSMNITAMDTPDNPIIPRTFYGLDVDPVTGMIYALDAKGFTTKGMLLRYYPDGTLADSVQVGIGPNSVYFHE